MSECGNNSYTYSFIYSEEEHLRIAVYQRVKLIPFRNDTKYIW